MIAIVSYNLWHLSWTRFGLNFLISAVTVDFSTNSYIKHTTKTIFSCDVDGCLGDLFVSASVVMVTLYSDFNFSHSFMLVQLIHNNDNICFSLSWISGPFVFISVYCPRSVLVSIWGPAVLGLITGSLGSGQVYVFIWCDVLLKCEGQVDWRQIGTDFSKLKFRNTSPWVPEGHTSHTE